MRASRGPRRIAAGIGLTVGATVAVAAVAPALVPTPGDFRGRTAQAKTITFDFVSTQRKGQNRRGDVRNLQTIIRLNCRDGSDRTVQVSPPQGTYVLRNSRFNGRGRLSGSYNYRVSGRFHTKNTAAGSLTVTGKPAGVRCKRSVRWQVTRTP